MFDNNQTIYALVPKNLQLQKAESFLVIMYNFVSFDRTLGFVDSQNGGENVEL